MEADKLYQRVLDIQKNIQEASSDQQTLMLNELVEIAAQIEKSLSEIQIDVDIDDLKINEDEE